MILACNCGGVQRDGDIVAMLLVAACAVVYGLTMYWFLRKK